MRNSKLVISSCLLMSLIVINAVADDEANLYQVDDFSEIRTYCNGAALMDDFDADDVYAFPNYLAGKLNTWGFDRRSWYQNSAVDEVDFKDSSVETGGADHVDPNGIDSADFGFVLTHGGTDEDRSWLWSGDYTGTAESCATFFGSGHASNEVEWGDNDLNWLILHACHSVERETWLNNALWVVDGNFTGILGFHGSGWNGSTSYEMFEEFVDDSRYDGLGSNWFNYHASDQVYFGGDYFDVCGTVSIYGGPTHSDRVDDCYYAGFSDWRSNGTGSVDYPYGSLFYYGGCEPRLGSELPQ